VLRPTRGFGGRAGDDPSRRKSRPTRRHHDRSLPLAPAAPQGCVALCAPVLRTPLPRAGFAVAGVSDGGVVNHDGRGWWDPLSEAKGDIFTLVRHLDPGLNFGAARRVLRGFVGIEPAFPAALRARRTRESCLPVAQRWDRRRLLSAGSPVWRYLTRQRGLPETILIAARAADAIREGPRGSAWFAHRAAHGLPATGV
jgi:hypothetical protein